MDGIRWSVHIWKWKNFMHLILPDEFWSVHMPFGSMVKFQFLEQFLVNYFPFPVMSRLVHFLRLFTAFAYMINHFVSIIT